MNLLRDQSVLQAGSPRVALRLDRPVSVIARIVIILGALLCLANIAAAGELVSIAGPTGPKLDIGKGGHCVEDPKFMRVNHMKLIVHQRDETMRKGIRGSKYELTNCVNCHASSKNNSVLGSSENFCQGCHEYAAVRIDCFECHSSKPRKDADDMITENLR
jgi:[DsrC]-trisulfide reductase subunit J